MAIDYIKEFLTTPANAAEVIALIAALFTLTGKKSGYWKLFIVFLVITIALEFTGLCMRKHKQPNTQLYNFFMIVQALFFAFLFSRFQASKKVRMIIIMGFCAFIIFLFTEQLINFLSETPKYKGYLLYSRCALSALVTVYACFFYFSILKNDNVISPIRYPNFWIVTGLFFYYFGSLPMFSFYRTVAPIKLSGNIYFFSLVMGCLSCILYGSWVIGFIWKRKEQILSSRQ